MVLVRASGASRRPKALRLEGRIRNQGARALHHCVSRFGEHRSYTCAADAHVRGVSARLGDICNWRRSVLPWGSQLVLDVQEIRKTEEAPTSPQPLQLTLNYRPSRGESANLTTPGLSNIIIAIATPMESAVKEHPLSKNVIFVWGARWEASRR